jgi:dTDP-4-dehydrorhamnose reductase
VKVLVTGREGQVARALAERGAVYEGLELVFAVRPQFDLTDPATIRATVRQVRPEVIVIAAAYTAVDDAENDEAAAHAVNAIAPGILADEARAIGARTVLVSTDYVFDGSGERAWRETDPVGPLGAYGRTKLAGEEVVRAATPDHLILRTAWVYSPFGRNFVRTMLRLAETRDELAVVDDQHGNPTSAYDIADGILHVLDVWKTGERTGLGGTYHLAGTGDATWCGFARHTLAESGARGGPSAMVRAITSAEFPTRARRPANSRLDCTRFKHDFGYRAPDWRRSVTDVVVRIIAGGLAERRQ